MAKPSLLAPPTSKSVKPTLIGDVSACRAALPPPPAGVLADAPPAPPFVAPAAPATVVAVAPVTPPPAASAAAPGVVPSATDCVSTLSFGLDTSTGTITPAASMPTTTPARTCTTDQRR